MDLRVIAMFFVISAIVLALFGLGVVINLIKHSNRPYKDENLLYNDGTADTEFKGFNFKD